MRVLPVLLLALRLAGAAAPQEPLSPAAQPKTLAQQKEDDELTAAINDANGSPVDTIRVLENHLRKYPSTPRLREIVRTLTKSAIELHDDRRVIEYGERSLAFDPGDLQILDRVTVALLKTDSTNPQKAARALDYAKRFEKIVLGAEKEQVDRRDAARRKDEVDRGMARAYLYQARALGTMGKYDEAIELAKKSYARYASENAAHEAGRWLAKDGKNREAAEMFANALMVPDPRATESDRADDRKALSEAWSKAAAPDSKGSLGDLILAAYDSTNALVAERNRKLKMLDPNRDVTDPIDYTISRLEGAPVKLSDLKGKVLVLDFWATWCGPCRAQYPLYEEVKMRFKDRKDVMFLAIDSDEDTSLVKPFLEKMKWNKNVYFDDGLARLMQVSSIPATVIFDKQGRLSSRMNGYLPDRFVDMLSERIRYALGEEEPAK